MWPQTKEEQLNEAASSLPQVLERQILCKVYPEKECYMLADAETEDYFQVVSKDPERTQ